MPTLQHHNAILRLQETIDRCLYQTLYVGVLAVHELPVVSPHPLLVPVLENAAEVLRVYLDHLLADFIMTSAETPNPPQIVKYPESVRKILTFSDCNVRKATR